MTTNNPTFVPGETIRRLRSLKGIMQKEVCIKMGISQQAYSKIELSKKVPYKKVLQILKALNSNGEELANILKFSAKA